MRKGTIDQTGHQNVTMAIDCELLFSIKRNFFLRKKFTLSDYNRKVLLFVHDHADAFDRVVVGCVGDLAYRRHIFTKILGLQFQLIDLGNEENYSNWLKMLQPEIHLAVAERRYYSKNSVLVTEDFLSDNPT